MHKMSKKINIFLMLVLILTLVTPSFAGTGITNIEVFVTESDGQITLQWNDPDYGDFSRMKITGAAKTVYVDKGVQQAIFTNLVNGIEYSFRLSAISNSGVILGETVVFGIPRDETPPERVSNAYGIPDDGCIFLYWNDPADKDLDRIRIEVSDRVIEVDKGVEQLLIDSLDNGIEYRLVITAVDTSGNESDGVVITSIPEEGVRIHLSGPEQVQSEQTFSVTMDVSSSRNDIYAVQASLQYDADYFQYIGYEEPENGISVIRIDESTEGCITVYVARTDNTPITGQGNRIITLEFKAGNVVGNYTGLFNIENALAGTAPPGDQIPVASNSINITIASVILPEVSDVKVLSGDTKITLSWTDPPGDEYDRILIMVDGTKSYTVEKGQQTITIPDLINGEVYQFVLKTMDSEGNTSQGVTVYGSPEAGDQIPPSEVTNITVKAGNCFLKLNWNDPEDADFKKVIITVNNSDVYEVDKGVQQLAISGLVNGQVVAIKIQTVDETGNTSAGISITGIPGILGDVNYDGVINVGDLAIAAYNYLVREGDLKWEQARHCDVTGNNEEPDGIVDILDITFIAKKMLEQQ